MTQPTHELRDHWRVVMAAAIGAGCGITGMTTYSLGVLINPLSDAFGWSRTEVSAAKTFITLGFVLTAPFIGYVADKFGVRRIAMLSLFGLSMAMLAMTQLNGNILAFYAALMALAFAGCATTPLVWTRGVATWFEKKRGLALGLTLTGSGLAGVIAPAALSALIKAYDWRAAFIGMAIAALLALIPVYFFFFENGRQANQTKATRAVALNSGFTVPEAFRSRRFWQFGFAFMLIGGVVSALVVHLVPLLTDAGMTRDLAVKMASALGVSVILGRVTTGYLVDRFHPPFVAATFLSAPIIGCLLLSGDPGSTWLVILAAMTVGIAAGSEVDLVPYLAARYFGLKSYGKLYGWIFVFFYAGVGVGPLFLGRMYDLYGSYDVALDVAIPTLALGVLAIATLGKPPQFNDHSSNAAG